MTHLSPHRAVRAGDDHRTHAVAIRLRAMRDEVGISERRREEH